MPTFAFIVTESAKEAAFIFFQYWWLFTPFLLWPIFELAWVNYVQEKYIRSIKWDLLEIKISKEIEKRPKTMEEVFSGLYSSYDVMIDTLYDIYLGGVVDLWFSLEIVSTEGDVHFYIRTPKESRSIVESHIYAQYPEAEIKEAEDYVLDIPDDIPSKDYDLWGTDMTLAKEDAYPIKVYKEFEDTASGEFIDPISNIIEGVNKLGKGEHIWIQVLIRAADNSWKKDADELVLGLIGRKKKDKKSFSPLGLLRDEIVDLGRHIVFGFFSSVNPFEKSEEAAEKDIVSMMLHLSPGEKDVVTAIDSSTKKPGYETNVRWMYIGKRENFDKAKGNSIVFSYFAQFGAQDLNSFVPDTTKTSAYYFLTELRKATRKRSILRRYKRREFDKKGYVLNTEELATIFHFPTIEVRAPLVPRIEAKKSKPPSGLPV